MSQHITGQDFDALVGDLMLHFEAMSATITDNRQATQSGGVPDGWVNGDVSCSGEFELDSKNFNLLMEAAKSAGSFRGLEPFDISMVAKLSQEKQNIELFGCLPTISDLLSLDPKGSEKSKHKIPFTVTSEDFVRINGVPYLSEQDTRNQ